MIEALGREWRDPVLRSAHLMALNTALTAGLGFVFWVIAARTLPVDAVGTGTAVVAVVMTIAGLGQLNLYQSAGVLLARAPGDGRAAAAKIWGLAVAATLAAALGVGLVTAVAEAIGAAGGPHLPAPLPVVVACTVAWTAFAVKDALLIARRRTGAVPALNTGYAVVKIGVLIAVTAILTGRNEMSPTEAGTAAIIAATFAPILVVVPVAAVIVALRRGGGADLPATSAGIPDAGGSRRADACFLAADYLGAVALLACTTLLPFLVYTWAGPEAAGVFAAAWVIVVVLDTLAHNAAVPLATELARDPSRAGEVTVGVARRTLLLVSAGAVVLAVGAGPLLSILGPAYAAQGTPVLQVFAAASVIRALVVLQLALLRAARRTGRIALVEAVHAATVLGVAAFAVPAIGAVGMAFAWLIGQGAALIAVAVLGGATVRGRRLLVVRARAVSRGS